MYILINHADEIIYIYITIYNILHILKTLSFSLFYVLALVWCVSVWERNSWEFFELVFGVTLHTLFCVAAYFWRNSNLSNLCLPAVLLESSGRNRGTWHVEWSSRLFTGFIYSCFSFLSPAAGLMENPAYIKHDLLPPFLYFYHITCNAIKKKHKKLE